MVVDTVPVFKTSEQSSGGQRTKFQHEVSKFVAQERKTQFRRVPVHFNHRPHILHSHARLCSCRNADQLGGGVRGIHFHFHQSTPVSHLVSNFYSRIFSAATDHVRRDVTGNEHIARTGRHDPSVSAERRLSIKTRTDPINSSL